MGKKYKLSHQLDFKAPRKKTEEDNSHNSDEKQAKADRMNEHLNGEMNGTPFSVDSDAANCNTDAHTYTQDTLQSEINSEMIKKAQPADLRIESENDPKDGVDNCQEKRNSQDSSGVSVGISSGSSNVTEESISLDVKSMVTSSTDEAFNSSSVRGSSRGMGYVNPAFSEGPPAYSPTGVDLDNGKIHASELSKELFVIKNQSGISKGAKRDIEGSLYTISDGDDKESRCFIFWF